MAEVLAEVRQAVSAAGIELDVVPGGEIGLDRLGTLTPRELDRSGLGGKSSCAARGVSLRGVAAPAGRAAVGVARRRHPSRPGASRAKPGRPGRAGAAHPTRRGRRAGPGDGVVAHRSGRPRRRTDGTRSPERRGSGAIWSLATRPQRVEPYQDVGRAGSRSGHCSRPMADSRRSGGDHARRRAAEPPGLRPSQASSSVQTLNDDRDRRLSLRPPCRRRTRRRPRRLPDRVGTHHGVSRVRVLGSDELAFVLVQQTTA